MENGGDGMSEPATYLELFGELVKALHNGGPPEGTLPSHYGDWREHAKVLLDIYEESGASGAAAAWRAWCADSKDLLEIYEPRKDYVLEDLRDILSATEWLWQGWLPRGYLTMLVAESGIGKSWFCLELARPILTGTGWPDQTPNETRGCVLYADTEASQALTLERADTLGLPTGKIRIPSPGGDILAPLKIDTQEGWSELEYQIDTYKPELVIVDSLSGSHGGDENSAEIRGLLFNLAELARNKQIALLVTHHLRKKSALDGAKIDLGRIRGNTAIAQFARLIFAIDSPDLLDNRQKRLYVVKSNLAEFPKDIGYMVTSEGIAYGDAPEPPSSETQGERATRLLIEWLSEGAVESAVVKHRAERAGISKRTLDRAKDELAIVHGRVGKTYFWAFEESQLRQLRQVRQDSQGG